MMHDGGRRRVTGGSDGPERLDAREAWNRGAKAWDEFVEGGADYYRTEVHGPSLLAACGKVRGLRALDLGCGQGYSSRQLAVRGARVVLTEPGRLVFSLPNPLTDTPYREWERDERDERGEKLALKIDRYFESGPRVTRWIMARLRARWETPYWYRTLAEWSVLLDEAGFLIRRLHEARPTREQVAQNPALDGCYRLPYFLVFDVVTALLPSR